MSNERTGVLELTLGDFYIGSAYSPQVEVTDTATGHEVAITYMSPEGIVTERFDVEDGATGPQGPAGYSPTVTIADTPTGHTVTITDADGPHSYDVPNYAQEEQERQDAWDALSGEVTDAIGDAETATSAASTAAQSATSAASSATSAAQAANTAASSATTAASSANAAATAANTAASDASAAATSANAAATSASNAADDASDAADEARQIAEDIQEELDAKADTHGQYPSLSVGRADALTGADESAQWATRVTAGSGATTVRSVQGASVGWNQLISGMIAPSVDGITATVTDGALSLSGTFASTPAGEKIAVSSKVNFIRDGRKYLIKANQTLPCYISINGFETYSSTRDQRAFFFSSSSGSDWNAALVLYQFASGDTIDISNLRASVFDLTAMFGAGNEPATVAEFEAMYPEAYYPYSAPTLKPVQIAGIASTDAQGGELDSVEWETQTLRAAGSVRDELTAGELVTRVGMVDLGELSWSRFTSDENKTIYYAVVSEMMQSTSNRIECGIYDTDVAYVNSSGAARNMPDKSISSSSGASRPYIYIKDSAYSDAGSLEAALSGVPAFYPLATPATTPISPALPMSYKIEQGGTESIIVPEGEASAAPVITVAEGESAADLVMAALACIATPDGPIATANHAINTYLTMQGKLYKVTSAIAVGETIAAGTNVTATTVMAELIARTA